MGLLVRILRDREAAGEVLREVFLRLWNDARRFHREQVSVAAGLVLMARSRAVARLRGAKRLPALRNRGAIEKQFSWLPRPNEVALLDERRELLKKVVAQLPKSQRDVLELAVFEGLAETEIARQMGETPARVRTTLLAAMRFLRHRLAAVLGTWSANI
jgi:RNA polymerase sigma-70 factor (ECF subfamily)